MAMRSKVNPRWNKDRSVHAVLLILFAASLSIVGVLPAASSGDEVWFSESAYWFLKEGVFARPMHDDNVGSSIRDFLPPMPAALQAVAFSVLGLTPFSLMIMPLLAAASLILLVFHSARALGLPPYIAGGVAVLPICLPIAFKSAFAPRYEVYLALFMGIWWFSARVARPDMRSGFLAGAALALAVVSYYQSIFIVLLLCLATVILSQRSRAPLRLIASAAVGGGMITLVFLLWIGKDFDIFLLQNLSSADGYDFSQRFTFETILVRSPVQFKLAFLAFVALISFYTFVRLRLMPPGASGKPEQKRLDRLLIVLGMAFGVAIVLAAVAFERLLMPAMVLLAIMTIEVVRLEHWKTPPVGHIVRAVLIFGPPTLSMIMICLAVAKGLGEYEMRDYAEFKENLLEHVDPSGKILTQSSGWLALREHTERSQLVHLIGFAPDASRLNIPNIALDPKKIGQVSTIILHARAEEKLRSLFPLVDRALDSEDFGGPFPIGKGVFRHHVFTRHPPGPQTRAD